MKPLQSSLSLLAALAIAVPTVSAQETATTDPVGFVTVGVTAGTGVGKRSTLLSLPLLEVPSSFNGQVAGIITAVGSNTISNSSAGWVSGDLAKPAEPYLVLITSGQAAGRMFLVSGNTSSTLTVSSADSTQLPNLANLGITTGTDTYRIFACDTLSSFFGTPATSGFLGGTSAQNSDTLVIVSNGSASTYYFNTSLGRWTRTGLGSPDASNTPLLPYYGIQYQRLGNTELKFVITGAVPTSQRRVEVKNSGITLLAQYWPANSTLAQLGLQNLAGWTSGQNAASSDTVTLLANGSATTYFYNGTNWIRPGLGGGTISNDVSIPVGASIQISKRGGAAGYTTLNQPRPYNL